MIVEGTPAPAFDLPLDRGGRASLKALRGGPAVLYFYPADGTETCTLEAQAFSARARNFKAAGARVIGISPDSIASHCKFRDKYDLAVELACDADLAACRAFEVWRSKTLFGRTYMGIERTTVLIDSKSRVARIWRKVRLRGHVEVVLASIAALTGDSRQAPKS